MLLLREPALTRIDSFLAAQVDAPFSYPEIGATRTGAPAGYTVDHNRVRFGAGEEVFRLAVAAMRQWKMFDLGWVRIAWPGAPLQSGTTVAVVARTVGIWSLNAARIVYTLDEIDGPVRRFGFAYGTLRDHAESGEERFSIELDRADGSVWYDLYAFSRPQGWLIRLAASGGGGLPLVVGHGAVGQPFDLRNGQEEIFGKVTVARILAGRAPHIE